MKLELDFTGITLTHNGKKIEWDIQELDDEGIVNALQDVLTEARKALGMDLAPQVPWMPARPVQTASGVRELDEGDIAEMRLMNGGAALRTGVGELDMPVIGEGNDPQVDWSQ